MWKNAFFTVLGLAGWLLLAPAAQAASGSTTLDAIRKHGELRVGVKTDFAPYNALNPEGVVVGFESDIAELIAKRLGVALKKVHITTENRFQKLELGEVDLLLATVGDTAARRQIATAVEPGYSETSVNVLFRPGQAVDAWPKLRLHTLCAVQGSYFNAPMSERYLLALQTYKTVRDTQQALHDGQCSGMLYATAQLATTLKLPAWQHYTMPLANTLITPMAIYIARHEKGSEFDLALGNIVADLHRNGWLLAANQQWGIGSQAWLREQQQVWSQRDGAGLYKCVRLSNGHWIAACRSGAYLSSNDVQGLQAIGLWIKEQLGVDLNFVYDPYDRTQFIQGVAYTMLLIACGIVLSLALGCASAIAVDDRNGWGVRALHAVMAYGRLTPPLLMMYLIFFGIGSWSMQNFGVKLPAFAVAAFCSGYYTAGMVMGAWLEAARHVRTRTPGYRLGWRQLLRSAPYASWPIKQALINLTKQTMIASAIAIPELLSAGSLLIAEKGNIFVTMTVLLLTFYLITSLWARLFDYLERTWLPAVERP